MKSRTLLSLIKLPFAALLVTAVTAFSQSPTQGRAFVPFESPGPAGIMPSEGQGLFLFTTGRGIPVLHSANFIDWELVDRVFPGRPFPEGMPAWAKKINPKATTLWTPDVAFHNGKYYLYYAISSLGSQRSAIGLATNKSLDRNSPDYKWVDEGIVLESAPGKSDYNAIDPAIFVDDDGKTYLFWGAHWTGVKAVELDPKTGKPFRYKKGELKIPADYVSIAFNPDNPARAPALVRRGDYYYLIVSWDASRKTPGVPSRIVVGRSKNPLGPYLGKDGNRMEEGGGTVLFAGTEKWKGVAQAGTFRSVKEGKNKGDWIVFHAIDTDNRRMGRRAQIHPLHWDKSGWPVVGELLAVPFEKFDFSATGE